MLLNEEGTVRYYGKSANSSWKRHQYIKKYIMVQKYITICCYNVLSRCKSKDKSKIKKSCVSTLAAWWESSMNRPFIYIEAQDLRTFRFSFPLLRPDPPSYSLNCHFLCLSRMKEFWYFSLVLLWSSFDISFSWETLKKEKILLDIFSFP